MEPIYGVSLGYFLWSLVLGAAAGVLYDLFRIKRKIVHTPGFAVIVEDIVYFILTGLAVFLIAFIKNSGQLRWQGLIGICAGFGFYRLLLRDVFVECSVKFIYFIVKIFKWIIKFFLFPFRVLYRYLLYPVFLRPMFWTAGKVKQCAACFCKKIQTLFVRNHMSEEQTEGVPESEQKQGKKA